MVCFVIVVDHPTSFSNLSCRFVPDVASKLCHVDDGRMGDGESGSEWRGLVFLAQPNRNDAGFGESLCRLNRNMSSQRSRQRWRGRLVLLCQLAGERASERAKEPSLGMVAEPVEMRTAVSELVLPH
jgi:hypothetical protein